MNTATTRREALQLVGAMGVGAAVCAGPALADEAALDESAVLPGGILPAELEATPVVIDAITDFADEKNYDVVIVGCGTTGMPAALAAAERAPLSPFCRRKRWLSPRACCVPAW